jgi:DNA-binding transcriptional MocR family regulator
MALARRVGEVRNVAASISVLHSHRRCSSGTPLPSLNPLAEELVSTHGVPESSTQSDLAPPVLLSSPPVAMQPCQSRTNPILLCMSWHVSVQEGSGIRKIMAKAWLLQASSPHERVIRLEVGQPNFATPQHVIDATVESLQQVENQGYIQSTGLPELRDAIAQMYTSRHRVPTSPEQVRTPLTLLLLHLERSHKIKRPKYKVTARVFAASDFHPTP